MPVGWRGAFRSPDASGHFAGAQRSLFTSGAWSTRGAGAPPPPAHGTALPSPHHLCGRALCGAPDQKVSTWSFTASHDHMTTAEAPIAQFYVVLGPSHPAIPAHRLPPSCPGQSGQEAEDCSSHGARHQGSHLSMLSNQIYSALGRTGERAFPCIADFGQFFINIQFYLHTDPWDLP